MADRSSTSTSRQGRPRTRSACQTPHVLVKPKVGRPRSKSAHASKISDSSLKPKGKKTPGRPPKQVRVVPQPEERVIEIHSDNLDIEFPFYPDRLPDLPPMEVEQPNPTDQQDQGVNQPPAEEQLNQVPNQPLDAPTEDQIQPLDAPVEEPNQLNQPNQPPILPDPMANQQQLNWSHFKPEFAGKADEDAEAHLLRTNDWMEAHNFPNDQKVRRFCLTLTHKARLWYETIRNVQLDWPTIQECFRQQYSKFGNTREQYFHVWRSFQFDEATDTIDGYIHKVKQVAALLDYGEPQILELFKTTLPSRLYYLLYQIDNLNAMIETAKRILTKEKIDKQKTGHSSTTPFMKASQDKSKKSEKGLSFGTLETKETIDRHSTSIDKLTSLVNKLDMKLDRQEAQYRPTVYENRNRGHGQRQNNYGYRNRSYH